MTVETETGSDVDQNVALDLLGGEVGGERVCGATAALRDRGHQAVSWWAMSNVPSFPSAVCISYYYILYFVCIL